MRQNIKGISLHRHSEHTQNLQLFSEKGKKKERKNLLNDGFSPILRRTAKSWHTLCWDKLNTLLLKSSKGWTGIASKISKEAGKKMCDETFSTMDSGTGVSSQQVGEERDREKRVADIHNKFYWLLHMPSATPCISAAPSPSQMYTIISKHALLTQKFCSPFYRCVLGNNLAGETNCVNASIHFCIHLFLEFLYIFVVSKYSSGWWWRMICACRPSSQIKTEFSRSQFFLGTTRNLS